MTDSAKDDFNAHLSDLKDSVAGLAKTAARLGAEAVEATKEEAVKRSEQAKAYTRENPGKALGIAAALGAVATVVFRRKR